MMPAVRRLLRSKLAGNFAASLYNQVAQILIQLVSVPIFSSCWGLDGYGVWLLLFTVPSYMAMADLGFSSAAGVDMTMRAARGDRAGAAATFVALRFVLAAVAACVFVITVVLLLAVIPNALDFADAATGGRPRETVLVLVLYGLFALQGGVSAAGFRATDGFATCGFIWVTVLIAEAAAAWAWAISGGGLFGAALCFLGVKILGNIVLALVLWRHAPWLHHAALREAFSYIRALLKPALEGMAFPLAQAFSLQGTVVVIGATLGPSAVPLFTTVRTLTRTALQMTNVVNMASLPAFSVAAAQNDRARESQLVVLALATACVVLLPAVPALLIGGQFIVKLWTGGAVHPPFMLIALMTVAMLFTGMWQPISNFILSINLHGRFVYFYLLVSAIGLSAAYGLAKILGIEGVGIALVACEGLMLLWIVRLAHEMGMLDRASLLATWIEGWHRIRGGSPSEPV